MTFEESASSNFAPWLSVNWQPGPCSQVGANPVCAEKKSSCAANSKLGAISIPTQPDSVESRDRACIRRYICLDVSLAVHTDVVTDGSMSKIIANDENRWSQKGEKDETREND